MTSPNKPSLDDYASTIELVFKKLAVCFKQGELTDAEADQLTDLPYNIPRILDADTCAEIIETARRICSTN